MSHMIFQGETTKVSFSLKHVCYVHMSLNTVPHLCSGCSTHLYLFYCIVNLSFKPPPPSICLLEWSNKSSHFCVLQHPFPPTYVYSNIWLLHLCILHIDIWLLCLQRHHTPLQIVVDLFGKIDGAERWAHVVSECTNTNDFSWGDLWRACWFLGPCCCDGCGTDKIL